MALKDRLKSILGRKGQGNISALADEYFSILLESDVNYDTAEYMKDKFLAKFSDPGAMVPDNFISAMKSIMTDVLVKVVPKMNLMKVEKKPYVILFIGINGTGKTTTVAKMAKYLSDQGKTVVVAASDTFRAGAIDQIKIHGENIGIRIISQQMGSDPSAVAFDAIEHAKARNVEYVIIDTAGRMQNNRNLSEEMKKIKRVSKPDLVILTVDALAANDAVEQAGTFLNNIGFDAIIVNKMDTDARGGAIFSIAHQFGKPILFLGIGQKLEDLKPYDPNEIISGIFP